MQHSLFEKKYYRIGEVGKITGLEPHVLRYWEGEFPVIRPKKDSGNQRLYSKNDIEAILEIKRLLYDENFTISGARKKMRTKGRSGESEPDPADSGERLREIKQELIKIRELLD